MIWSASPSVRPRSCRLARVVMSAQPFSAYGSMQPARKRSCFAVSSPLGTCARRMLVLGVQGSRKT